MRSSKLALNFARQINNELQSRWDLMDSVFGSFREYKIDHSCGYPIDITPQLYKNFYLREGIAARVVDIYPDECWQMKPEISDDEDNTKNTPFEESIINLDEEHQLMAYLHRVDSLSGIGRFGILLLGLDDGLPLDEPIEGIDDWGKGVGTDTPTRKLLYLRPFDESLVLINQFETNPDSPRYGKPLYYSVNFIDATQWGTVSPIGAETLTMKRIHWTRVIHVAERTSSSEIFGIPRMQPVFNRLFDMKKICGGSAEMFWKGGYPGLSLEVNPDMQDVDLDKPALDREMRAYHSDLKRYIALTGVSAKTLAPAIADPTPHFELGVKYIAMSLKCPYRVFTGTEQGVLAGAQDATAWAKRVEFRRENQIDPRIIRQTVDRLVGAEVIPLPLDGRYKIKWKTLTSPDAQTQSAIIQAKTAALAQYMQASVDNLIPPVDYFVQIFGMDREEAKEIVASAEKFLGVPLDKVAAKEMDQKFNPPQMGNNPAKSGQPAQNKPVGSPGKGFSPKNKTKTARFGKNMQAGVEKPRKIEFLAANDHAMKAVVERTCLIIDSLARLDKNNVTNNEEWNNTFAKSKAAVMSRKAITSNIRYVEEDSMNEKRASRLVSLHNEAAELLLNEGCKSAAKWHLVRGSDLAERYLPVSNQDQGDIWVEGEDPNLTENYDPDQPRDKMGKWTKTNAIYGPNGKSRSGYTGFIPAELKNPDAKGKDRIWVAPFGGKLPSNSHINSLNIPPGWTGVMIAPSKDSKLQAVGIDRAGKIQPKYRQDVQSENKSANFNKVDSMIDQGHDVQMIKDNKANLSSDDDVQVQHAEAFALMAYTGMRPGGAGADDTYGAADLEARHIGTKGGQVYINYVPGKKHGDKVSVPVTNAEFGKHLLELKASADTPRTAVFPDVTQSSLSKYVGTLNEKYTSKDMRTRMATSIARNFASKVHGRFNSEEAYLKWRKSLIKEVQKQIPDTPGVLLKSYISPSSYNYLAPKKG